MATKRSLATQELLRKTRTLCAHSIKAGDFTALGELVGLLSELVQIMHAAMKKGATPPAKTARSTHAKGRA